MIRWVLIPTPLRQGIQADARSRQPSARSGRLRLDLGCVFFPNKKIAYTGRGGSISRAQAPRHDPAVLKFFHTNANDAPGIISPPSLKKGIASPVMVVLVVVWLLR